MKKKIKLLIIVLVITGSVAFIIKSGCNPKGNAPVIQSWITNWNGENKLTPQKEIKTTRQNLEDSIIIRIKPEVRHQPILGFGGTFTDSDVYNFMRMDKEERTNALKALFDPNEGAGWNLMRISFGSTDWDRNWNFYTYDDMPEGHKDDSLLSHFSVEEDIKRGHFQLFREALQINPELKFHASVWSPPAWMKDNDKLISYGTILPAYYNAYAQYLIKSIEAYKKEGIDILAISPQNEPLCNDGRLTPQALYMDWEPMRDMTRIIRKKFQENNLDNEIWIFDHNFIYAKSWVEPFITDPSAKGVFDAVAWHDYEGSETELCELSEKYPDIPMYHTERSHYSTNGLMRILRIIRCGARSHNHWITISDEYSGPYQFGGGSEGISKPVGNRNLSALYNLRDNPNKWYRTPGYYTFAQLSKFVKRGAVKIESSDSGDILTNAAFQNADGSIILVVSNCNSREMSFVVTLNDNNALLKIPAQSAATYLIK